MRVLLIASFDEQAKCFGRPSCFATEGLAVRAFTEEVNRKSDDNALNKYPRDFSLWTLGVYDDETGVVELDKRKLVDAYTLLVNDE